MRFAQRNTVPRRATPRRAMTFSVARYALNRDIKFGARKGPFGITDDFARRCCSLLDRNTTQRNATSCNAVRCALNVTYVWGRGKARAASAAVAAACSITSYRGHATQHRTMLSDAARRALQCNVQFGARRGLLRVNGITRKCCSGSLHRGPCTTPAPCNRTQRERTQRTA